MRTSINDLVDRRGGALPGQELETLLTRTRRCLADISAVLELENGRLLAEQFEEIDDARIKQLQELVSQTTKAWQAVIELEARAGHAPATGPSQLDLEAARAEILRRLIGLAS